MSASDPNPLEFPQGLTMEVKLVLALDRLASVYSRLQEREREKTELKQKLDVSQQKLDVSQQKLDVSQQKLYECLQSVLLGHGTAAVQAIPEICAPANNEVEGSGLEVDTHLQASTGTT